MATASPVATDVHAPNEDSALIASANHEKNVVARAREFGTWLLTCLP